MVKCGRSQWQYLQAQQRLSRGSDLEWGREKYRSDVSRQARATRMSRTHTIVVDTALQAWHASKRIVLKVPHEFVKEMGMPGFVGVLW